MKKSLAEKHPFLIQEWSDRNLPLTPEQLTYGSNKRVWWKRVIGIHLDINLQRDRDIIYGCFRRWNSEKE